MNIEQANRELQRVRELANEYTKKGYTIVYPQSDNDLPLFLRGEGYMPDLIATSDKENLVIEVKTSKTVRHDKYISRISELVNSRPKWQFLFVLTNPRNKSSVPVPPVSERWQELLSKSRHPALQLPELSEAAFVLAWAALEGVIREASVEELTEGSKPVAAKVVKSPMSQIRDAVILGLVDRKDLTKLEKLFYMRNSIVHSTSGPRPSLEDVHHLQLLVDEIALTSS
ncbi:hypothetical protein J3Q09_14005 [Pseudomonas sp. R4-83]|uniref:hypothetical protein n=1 Tax=unclassified Pseudomonas TaxID=196821 RepID=UPI003DA8EAC4